MYLWVQLAQCYQSTLKSLSDQLALSSPLAPSNQYYPKSPLAPWILSPLNCQSNQLGPWTLLPLNYQWPPWAQLFQSVQLPPSDLSSLSSLSVPSTL